MGNTNGQTIKIGKNLTDENIAELSALSGFTPEQVQNWHTGFLVSRFLLVVLSCLGFDRKIVHQEN